jgi:hypothetical protein
VASRRCCWRLLTGEWLGQRSTLLFLFCVFSSALFFLSFPVLFLLPLSDRSFVSVVATVVAHGASGDNGGRMWLQMVVPGGGFSSFLLCFCFSFFFLFLFLCIYFSFWRWLCGCWRWLLVTGQNDGGAASNGKERETRERGELLFFSPVLLFFCSLLLFSRQLKSSPLYSSTLFSKQSLFLSQTIPRFLLSIRFSSSSSFPKIFAPSSFLFSLFLSPWNLPPSLYL